MKRSVRMREIRVVLWSCGRRNHGVTMDGFSLNGLFSRVSVVVGLVALTCTAYSLGPKIALVPVVNLAGEKWEQLKARQSNTCNAYLHDQFASRGFQIS